MKTTGFTKIPNKILEELAVRRLTGIQLRAILWVARGTFGWNQRYTNSKSVRAIGRALGVHVKSIQLAINVLIEGGLLDRNKEGGLRIIKSIEKWDLEGDGSNRQSDGSGRQGIDGSSRQSDKDVDGSSRHGDGPDRQGDGPDRRPPVRGRIKKLIKETPKDTCTEQGTSSALVTQKVYLTFLPVVGKKSDTVPTDLRERFPGKHWGLTSDRFKGYVRDYPAVDVKSEIIQATNWLKDNPKRKKTYGGMASFLTRWMGRAQNRAPAYSLGNKRGPDTTQERVKSLTHSADRIKDFS